MTNDRPHPRLAALERELESLPRSAPRDALRGHVLESLRGEARRQWRRALGAALAASLAAAALVGTRPRHVPPPSRAESHTHRREIAAIVTSLGLDRREEERLAWLAAGRSSLLEVAPVPTRPSFAHRETP